MKKAKEPRDGLRAEYTRGDFPAGLVRGKYAPRGAARGSIVRLDPEIAAAFPTSKAVNEALGAVLAARAAVPARRSPASARAKTSRAGRGPRKPG
jgi:hypothetical protein